MWFVDVPRCDLGEVRAARALAALDPVHGHADVVRGGLPGELDLGRARAVAASVPGALGGVASGGAGVVAVAVFE